MKTLPELENFDDAILDSVSDKIAVINSAGVIVMVNEPWRKFAAENTTKTDAQTPLTYVGRNYLEVCQSSNLIPSDNSLNASDGITAVLNRQLPLFKMNYVCHAHEQQRWLKMKVTPLSGAGEHGAVISHTNITDFIQNKEALQASEERFKFALEGSGDGMWDWNITTNEVLFSKRWKEMLGFTEDEISGNFEEWKKRIHSEDIPRVMANITSYFNNETPLYTNEHRLLCKDGTYKWILCRGIVKSRRLDGTPTRMVGTHTDVTTRRQAEDELRIAAVAFDTYAGVIVADLNRVILRVNPAFSRITGYSEKEAVGQPVTMLRSGQHDTNFYQSMWDAILCDQHWQGEIWEKRKNGDIFPVWLAIAAVAGPDGDATHYVYSFQDISLQKQAEKVLLEARNHLEKSMQRSVAELANLQEEYDDTNTALKVMMKMRRTEGHNAKNNLAIEIKSEVMPFLNRLKGSHLHLKDIRLLETLEANLQRLISGYGGASGTLASYKCLTPKEIQVASMVREGFATKVIASTLSLSPETISIHRKNIREKLGLDHKSDNLRSHLLTLAE